MILRESISGHSCGREGFLNLEILLSQCWPPLNLFLRFGPCVISMLLRVLVLRPPGTSATVTFHHVCLQTGGLPSGDLGAGAQVSWDSVASVNALRELVRWGDHSLFQKYAEAVGVQC